MFPCELVHVPVCEDWLSACPSAAGLLVLAWGLLVPDVRNGLLPFVWGSDLGNNSC